VSDANRTEQATPRRRQKARERGQVARTRELPSALVVLVVVTFLWWQPHGWRAEWVGLFNRALHAGPPSDLGPLLQLTAWLVIRWTIPVLLLGWAIAVVGSAVQGGLVFAPAALEIKPDRLNPASNLQRLFSSASLQSLLKSLVPVGIILYLTVAIVARDWNQILGANHLPPRASTVWILGRLFEIGWKAGLVFVAWSIFDYMLSRFNYERQLRMSKEEIREESKETEGHPTIRMRIRRVQRQMRQRRMLKNIERATVVITNPTEYAVALEYRPEEMAAPVVLAKGRNLLAQRIKKEASWHGIPIVENPPLAQALYRAVEVGQAIPAKLYAAVAEILAFIYRVQAQAHEKNRNSSGSYPRKGI
jgi:flagellar biosynthetic protein FlhB